MGGLYRGEGKGMEEKADKGRGSEWGWNTGNGIVREALGRTQAGFLEEQGADG